MHFAGTASVLRIGAMVGPGERGCPDGLICHIARMLYAIVKHVYMGVLRYGKVLLATAFTFPPLVRPFHGHVSLFCSDTALTIDGVFAFGAVHDKEGVLVLIWSPKYS
jgi:hypothetical protein